MTIENNAGVISIDEIAYGEDGDELPVGEPSFAYQWLVCDTADGTYADVEDETDATYEPTAVATDKYYKVEVTASGTSQGTDVSTNYVKIDGTG